MRDETYYQLIMDVTRFGAQGKKRSALRGPKTEEDRWGRVPIADLSHSSFDCGKRLLIFLGPHESVSNV